MRTLGDCAATARTWLFEHALPLWWTHGFDRRSGCFVEALDFDLTPAPVPLRVRVQARQTFVYARAGRMGWGGPWREAVGAGATTLLTRCLRPDGGARHLLTPSGLPLDDRRDLYDGAFVILALAEAAHVLGDRPDLIAAAETLLRWIERTWTHAQGGFEEGEACPAPPRRQNPHMHMFEALLALHEATGSPAHLERASALAALFHDKLFNEHHGVLTEYYDDAWRPMSDELGRIVEPGHLFEWSWLLNRWSSLSGAGLGREAERLRAFGEAHGVDRESGAIHDEVLLDGQPRRRSSRLWPHTERLKANLVRYERAGDEDAARAAAQAFDMLMAYCDTPVKGLWRDLRQPDGAFAVQPAPASSFYHIIVALAELDRVASPKMGG